MASLLPRPLSIRLATSYDAKALVTLQQAIYEEQHWFVGDGPLSANALTRKLRSLDRHKVLYLLCMVSQTHGQEAVCAWLELSRHHSKRVSHVAVLTLAVDEAYRRQGIAKALLKQAYAWAKRVGIYKISLNVRAHNHAAIGLYKQQGFVVEGRERCQILLGSNDYEDNIIMAKYLGPLALIK